MKKYEELWKSHADEVLDPDLITPHNSALDIAKTVPAIQADVKLLEKHVEECLEKWSGIWRQSKHRSSSFESSIKEKEDRKAKGVLVGRTAQAFERNPEGIQVLGRLGCLDSIKASYAYKLKPKAAYSIAMRQLCDIKAKARGSASFTTAIGETMSISPATARILNKTSDDMEY